jgi:hypothetical protein
MTDPGTRRLPADGSSVHPKEEAVRIGADAVFFVTQRSWVTNYVYWDPAWGPSNHPVPSRIIVGAAIKYTGG